MAKKSPSKRLLSICIRLTRKFFPNQIQSTLATLYEEYASASASEGEYEFWHKCARASENLSKGMEKWLYEIEDEEA